MKTIDDILRSWLDKHQLSGSAFERLSKRITRRLQLEDDRCTSALTILDELKINRAGQNKGTTDVVGVSSTGSFWTSSRNSESL